MTRPDAPPSAQVRRHPTALVDPGARIGDSVVVGPYAVIGPDVEVGAGSVLESFVVIEGHTVLGPDNRIGTGAVLGGEPQDVKYRGEPTRLVLGRGNRVGPYVIVHRGTPGGHGVTVVGDECVLEPGSHIGHDCTVGSRVRLGAGSAVAGHTVIDDGVEVGPLAGIHQFTHVGRLARIEGHAIVTMDVPPFAV
ncbi:MAG: acyl-[acyl-carrier-protein]--UDP-N-acetylglucosamine O-acyltransferase, partial [Bacillota bacterium]